MTNKNLSSRLFLSLQVLILAGSLCALSATTQAASALPDVSPEGLKLLENTKAHAVYMSDGADFSGYDKVAIFDPHVAFKKNWEREQKLSGGFRVSDKDMMEIKGKLGKELKIVFTEELSASGLEVVNDEGPGVLILHPAILNLDVAAPDVMQAGRSRTFTTSAGQMTLLLEVYDGVSGDLLARVIDPQKARDYGMMQVTNGVTNKADADRILKKWAKALGEYLQSARSGGSGANP